MQKFRVYPNHFFYDGPLDLTFPDDWDVRMCKMTCHDEVAMTSEEIRRKISDPIGSEPLRELASDRKEAVIMVDDMSRITKAGVILPHVLKELNGSGISDDHIRIMVGCGSHGHHWLEHLAKKVGGDILERINVFTHSPWMNLVDLGKTLGRSDQTILGFCRKFRYLPGQKENSHPVLWDGCFCPLPFFSLRRGRDSNPRIQLPRSTD